MEGSEKFYNLSPEKQKAILNAGFHAFAKNGYQKTAMNDVARAAGISKPLLFYYFSTKKDFYVFLFRTARDIMERELQEGGEDFFECISIAMKIKIKVMRMYPGLHAFFRMVIREENMPLIRDMYQDSQQKFLTSSGVLFKNVNWNKFKPEFEQTQIYRLVSYVSNGVVRDYIHCTPEEIIRELEPLLKMLKAVLYREEYV